MLNTQELHPGLANWLSGVNEQVKLQGDSAARRITPGFMRKSLARMTDAFVTDAPAIARVQDSIIGRSIPLRIYDPSPDIPKPVTLFLHGGGHMCGSIQVYDPICRKLANASGQLIVAPDYRLAPEHPYPAALEDCYTVIQHLWSHLDDASLLYTPTLSLAGDSGGGALCATLSALSQQDPNLPISRQALIYPSLDYTLSSPSVDTLAHGYLLEKPRIQWYFDHYFQADECRRSASPLFMPVSSQSPATLMVTAGFCPLRDEGSRYLERLTEAGVATEHHLEPSMIHAYLNLEDLVPQASSRTYEAVARFLNSA
ncbi:alpha/beta hydrolase [Marinobacter daepoensis]|uniref:Alpha/beta hydrolase n=1 Tax=Marinobacter daepoensis TaxID=262077 RepID=A0ABS3B9U6_9GAMM|nr:alpha/beta hydrolase [Marinobacter daepoensis]MBN7768634.1 alpha/beta hydrolase [Marinobacter daepoensis]MBY6079371.1 alpha/beta hydrolase [Marinobacter daepoensis]